MAKEVKQVTFTKAAIPKLTRVAAYARVSSAKNAMHHSLSAQVSYYSGLIQNHPGWQYIGVYADEAKTGTKDTREGFVKLVSDCKAGRSIWSSPNPYPALPGIQLLCWRRSEI